VKLYPRLAMTHPSKKPVSNRRLLAIQSRALSKQDREADKVQVRARLLRMIVENERVRRGEQRPNAS
jgi:hypothetical protein